MRHKVPDRKALLDESNSAFLFGRREYDSNPGRFSGGFSRVFSALAAVVQEAPNIGARSTSETLQTA
jgi:hypothetical protein